MAGLKSPSVVYIVAAGLPHGCTHNIVCRGVIWGYCCLKVLKNGNIRASNVWGV